MSEDRVVGYTEPRWIRHRPDAPESRAALVAGIAVGVAVGAAALYLARLLLAREPIVPTPTAIVPARSAPVGVGEREAR